MEIVETWTLDTQAQGTPSFSFCLQWRLVKPDIQMLRNTNWHLRVRMGSREKRQQQQQQQKRLLSWAKTRKGVVRQDRECLDNKAQPPPPCSHHKNKRPSRGSLSLTLPRLPGHMADPCLPPWKAKQWNKVDSSCKVNEVTLPAYWGDVREDQGENQDFPSGESRPRSIQKAHLQSDTGKYPHNPIGQQRSDGKTHLPPATIPHERMVLLWQSASKT